MHGLPERVFAPQLSITFTSTFRRVLSIEDFGRRELPCIGFSELDELYSAPSSAPERKTPIRASISIMGRSGRPKIPTG